MLIRVSSDFTVSSERTGQTEQTQLSRFVLLSPLPFSSQIIVFNRVRRMTSDLSLLVDAMRRSNELEIMEQVR